MKKALGYEYVVGSSMAMRDAAGLKIEIVRQHEPCVVALWGELSLRTVGSVAKALTKLLLNHDQVMVNLAHLHVGWTPALQVFPTALASAGGWPFARLVLFGADEQMSTALHGMRVPTPFRSLRAHGRPVHS